MSARPLEIMMKRRTAILALACHGSRLAGRAHAQKKGDDASRRSRPPKGMCRIWLDKVPRQAAARADRLPDGRAEPAAER